MELLSVWSRMIYSSFTQDTNLDIHNYYLSYHLYPFPKIGTASSLKKSYLLKETY